MELVELRSLVVIAMVVAAAPFVTAALRRVVPLPGVVVEIVLGIVVGPFVLGWVTVGDGIALLAELGLVFLIFLAGFEVRPERLRGRPVQVAATGWLLSLAIGFGLASLLHVVDATSSIRFVALALTATAVGILLPILADAGVTGTRLGDHAMAGGVLGELGPIVAVSVLLTADDPGLTTLVVIGFAAIAVLAAHAARRTATPRLMAMIAGSFRTSGQIGVRLAVAACLALVWAAAEFGLDVLVGAFAAGVVVRTFLVAGRPEPTTSDVHRPDGEPAPVDQEAEMATRLEGIGYGALIPLFFVVSGVRFDLDAVTQPVELIMVPLFLVMFVVTRGLPALLAWRDLPRRDVAALALLQASTLPLVVVISEIGRSTGQMGSEDAAGLVGAGLLSVVLFPLVAMAVRSRHA